MWLVYLKALDCSFSSFVSHGMTRIKNGKKIAERVAADMAEKGQAPLLKPLYLSLLLFLSCISLCNQCGGAPMHNKLVLFLLPNFSIFFSLLFFSPIHPIVLMQPSHSSKPATQSSSHQRGSLTPLYVALKMPVPALALTISTMANAAQYQTKQQQIVASKGQWWQSKERWRSRSLQTVGLGFNGRWSGSRRAFSGIAIRQIEESLDRCHVGDAVCGGGDAQPRETTLTAASGAFSCLRRHRLGGMWPHVMRVWLAHWMPVKLPARLWLG